MYQFISNNLKSFFLLLNFVNYNNFFKNKIVYFFP